MIMLKLLHSHISLFIHREFLEVPDNWRMERFYNVPLDELIEIMDYSLNNGYTVNWDGDVSEKGFSHSKGLLFFLKQIVTQEMRSEARIMRTLQPPMII